MVAAAIVGGAVVGGLATTVAGNKASSAQRDAAKSASDTELQMFNQNREDLAPYRQAGYTALGQIGAGLQEGGDFNRDFTMEDFNQDPGRQFRFDTGQQALERSASARGGILNGGTLKALTRYGQDYATQEYSSAYSRFNGDRDRRFNRLASVAGIGQTAATQTAQLGTQTAGNIGANITAAGNATAANAVNTGNAVNSTVGSLGQFYLQNKFLNNMSGSGGGGSAPAAGWYQGKTYAELNP
jgi:hypothetical protein